MLEHQLPALLPVTTFWEALPEIFDWLQGAVAQPLAAMPVGADNTLIRERVVDLPTGSQGQNLIEMIRFAAANRLLVEIDYRDKQGNRSTRAIEAYSLRRSQAGDVLLMAVRADSGQPRSYLVNSILGVQPTQTSFAPRYPIELTPSGPQSIPRTAKAGSRNTFGAGGTRTVRRSPARRSTRSTGFRAAGGPTYVFKRTVCGKTFYRKKCDATLNEHKHKRTGYQCYGTIGRYVRTKYQGPLAVMSRRPRRRRGGSPPRSSRPSCRSASRPPGTPRSWRRGSPPGAATRTPSVTGPLPSSADSCAFAAAGRRPGSSIPAPAARGAALMPDAAPAFGPEPWAGRPAGATARVRRRRACQPTAGSPPPGFVQDVTSPVPGLSASRPLPGIFLPSAVGSSAACMMPVRSPSVRLPGVPGRDSAVRQQGASRRHRGPRPGRGRPRAGRLDRRIPLLPSSSRAAVPVRPCPCRAGRRRRRAGEAELRPVTPRPEKRHAHAPGRRGRGALPATPPRGAQRPGLQPVPFPAAARRRRPS